jgi:hypothetical protein
MAYLFDTDAISELLRPRPMWNGSVAFPERVSLPVLWLSGNCTEEPIVLLHGSAIWPISGKGSCRL